jgi:hypothetical protein
VAPALISSLSIPAFPGAFILRSFISLGGVFVFEAEVWYTALLCPSGLDMHSLFSELGLEARVG